MVIVNIAVIHSEDVAVSTLFVVHLMCRESSFGSTSMFLVTYQEQTLKLVSLAASINVTYNKCSSILTHMCIHDHFIGEPGLSSYP